MKVFRKRSYFACWIIDSKQIAFLILFCFFIPLNIVHIYEASGIEKLYWMPPCQFTVFIIMFVQTSFILSSVLYVTAIDTVNYKI